jgi:hypothetical protein
MSAIETLRHILDEVLERNEVFIAEEIFERIAAAIPKRLSFSFVLRERRHFENKKDDVETEFLNFPFLSFQVKNKQVSRFFTPREIRDLLHESKKNSLKIVERPNSVIVCRAADWKNYNEILSLVRRVVLTFYYVCGSREHFLDSVTRRFLREHFREHGLYDVDVLLQALSQKLGVDVIYGIQSRSDAEFEPLYDNQKLYQRLLGSPAFRSALQNSIARKSSYFGATEGNALFFSVTTLTQDNFIIRDGARTARTDDEFTRRSDTYKPVRRAVLILARSGHRINADAGHIGRRMLSTAINFAYRSSREDSIFSVFARTAELEEEISAAPLATRSEIDRRKRTALEAFLKQLFGLRVADEIIVYLHNPFNHSLAAFFVNGQDGKRVQVHPSTVNIDEASPQATAFNQDFVSEPFDEANTSIPRSCSKIFLPIIAGAIRVGVIEYRSYQSRDLEPDYRFLKHTTSAAGEIIRRIELANDRSWLSRLSYIHAARHRLESLVRRLKSSNQETLSEELQDILQKYSELNSSNALGQEASEAQFRQRVCALLSEAECSSEELEQFLDSLSGVLDLTDTPSRIKDVLLELLETLASNGHHSKLRLSDLRLELTPQSEETGPFLSLQLNSTRGRLPVEQRDKVTVAPIPDEKSLTYHFGLFLMAAQIRMIGGSAMAGQDDPPHLGSAPFRLSFQIPLG